MSKKSEKNIIFGLLNQLVVIIFGLLLPRMFITSYGSEINGLVSSVNQIYTYVALLEAGVGTASLQALYKTIANDDINETNSVLSATHRFYKRTGILYFLSVILISILYPLIVKSNIPTITIVLVILFNGLGGVVNYFFQGKYRILLRAEGKNYVLSNLSTVIYFLTNAAKIVLILFGFDVAIVTLSHFIVNLLQMSFIMLYIKKNYKWIDLKVKPNNDAISSKNSVMIHQISNLVFSNTDILILTLLSGLKDVSVYSLYNSFFTMCKSILFSFLDGVQYALGQTFNSDFEKFKEIQERFESLYMVLTFMIYSVLYSVISPFIAIYTRGISDANYIDKYIPLLFTLVYLLQGARGPMQLVSEYAQHFKQTQHQAIIEMVINLSVTITSVLKFGIYGVLFGTIAALLYRANAIIIYTNKVILKKSPFGTYKRWGWCFVVFLIIYFILESININIKSYVSLTLFAIPVAIIIVILYIVGMFIFERKSLLYLLEILKNKLRIK